MTSKKPTTDSLKLALKELLEASGVKDDPKTGNYLVATPVRLALAQIKARKLLGIKRPNRPSLQEEAAILAADPDDVAEKREILSVMDDLAPDETQA